MREFLVLLSAVFLLIAGCVWGPLITRLPLLWLCLANAALVGATVLAWHWIVRPYQIREKRRDQGLCVSCGYDPCGNVSDVCPECGRSERDNENVHDWP